MPTTVVASNARRRNGRMRSLEGVAGFIGTSVCPGFQLTPDFLPTPRMDRRWVREPYRAVAVELMFGNLLRAGINDGNQWPMTAGVWTARVPSGARQDGPVPPPKAPVRRCLLRSCRAAAAATRAP